jgi:hypothetical protein
MIVLGLFVSKLKYSGMIVLGLILLDGRQFALQVNHGRKAM